MPRDLLYGFAIAIVCCGLVSTVATAWAQDEHVVAIPLIFSQESNETKTSACITAREKIYDASQSSWVSFSKQARTNPDLALVNVIAAIMGKQEGRLSQLSHSRLGREPKRFQEQAIAFFQQFDMLRLSNVLRFYRLGNHMTYFVQYDLQGKHGVTDFAFARDGSESVGFLPYGDNNLALEFLSRWFYSEWGPAKARTPNYCAAGLLQRATHRISLTGPNEANRESPGLLLLGQNLAGSQTSQQPYVALRSVLAALKNSLRDGRFNQFFAGFTDEGRKSVESWFQRAEQAERQKYIDAFLNQEPFYVFDADPLFIVYTRTGSSAVQALYFVRDRNAELKWANAAYGTAVDRIFKSETLIAAATGAQAFDDLRIRTPRPTK